MGQGSIHWPTPAGLPISFQELHVGPSTVQPMVIQCLIRERDRDMVFAHKGFIAVGRTHVKQPTTSLVTIHFLRAKFSTCAWASLSKDNTSNSPFDEVTFSLLSSFAFLLTDYYHLHTMDYYFTYYLFSWSYFSISYRFIYLLSCIADLLQELAQPTVSNSSLPIRLSFHHNLY